MGVLLMDLQATFRSVAKGRLVNLMNIRQMDREFIQLTERFPGERTGEIIIKATPWRDTQ